MRIVSGDFRSRQLKTLAGDQTRPTSDKIRGSLFDSIAFEKNLYSILDLFSGSGAIGLEALSRGFKTAVMNDKNKQAIKIIKENIDSLNVKEKTRVYTLDYKQCLNVLKGEQFDVIFLDPPYQSFDINEMIGLIEENDLLSDHGILIIEEAVALNFENTAVNLKLFKHKHYKTSALYYLRKED